MLKHSFKYSKLRKTRKHNFQMTLIASLVYEHFELVEIYIFEMVRFSAYCVFLPNGRLTSTISKVLFAANGLSVQLECCNHVQSFSIFLLLTNLYI